MFRRRRIVVGLALLLGCVAQLGCSGSTKEQDASVSKLLVWSSISYEEKGRIFRYELDREQGLQLLTEMRKRSYSTDGGGQLFRDARMYLYIVDSEGVIRYSFLVSQANNFPNRGLLFWKKGGFF